MQLDHQFEDAEGGTATAIAIASTSNLKQQSMSALAPVILAAPRQPGAFIDDIQEVNEMKEVNEQWDEEEYDEDEWNSEDEMDQRVNDMLDAGMDEINDQDWDVLSGDFTKRYNRMRQLVVATHAALPRFTALSVSSDPAVRPGNIVPASNRARSHATTSASNDPSASTGVHLNKVSDQLANFSRYATRIDLAPLYPTNATTTRKGGSEKVLIKDKNDRATNEQVMDPRTRLIIFKMIGRGLIERIDGCVSTGKEANVYHAITPEGKHLALKIYKTSILVFKDRDRYVSGEFRFKSGYARSNPRKMVRLWAEKEMRNLRRMRTAGMRVPEAYEVRENVLVMEFMGADEEWQASPRLKDAEIPADRTRDLYIELLVILRTIFHRCRLVHADFSEYNILYHEDHLVVIDVSQSVEQDHPHAFDFLRSDIQNGDEFFARRGIDTLGLTRTFAFVTQDSWIVGRPETDEDVTKEADRLITLVESEEAKMGEEATGEDEEGAEEQQVSATTTTTKPSALDEAVFAQSYIPRALDQVYDPERDVARVLRGEGDALIYSDITGVAAIQKTGARFDQDGVEISPFAVDDGTGTAPVEDGDESTDEFMTKTPRGHKHEDRTEKKERRDATKTAAREKRQDKMSKGDKARKIRKTSGKK